MNNQQWKNIYWAILEEYIIQLQYRIYNAEKDGDWLTVLKLQKILYYSWSAKSKASQPYIIKKIKQFNLLNKKKYLLGNNPNNWHICRLNSNQKFYYGFKKKLNSKYYLNLKLAVVTL